MHTLFRSGKGSFQPVLFILACLFSFAALGGETGQQIIPFGHGNRLIINSSTGLFGVDYQGKRMISNASASFSSNGRRYQSADYKKRSFRSAKMNKAGGEEGVLFTLVSEGQGLPRMLQRFYCYRNRDFLVIELEINGKALKSNYMAPLVCENPGLPPSKELRTLFVPFDNDTFISYNPQPLTPAGIVSAEVGAVYDNQSRNGLIAGSLNHDVWKTGIKSSGSDDKLQHLEIWGGLSDVKITRDSMEHGFLRGSRIVSPKMFVGYFSDWRQGLETYASAHQMTQKRFVTPWKGATPVGWNSWGVIAEHLNYEKATGVVDFFASEIPSFRNDNGTAFMDLDAFWDNMVKGGFTGDFSRLKDFVQYCRERHLEPGVYFAPFTDWGFRSGGERTAEGSNYKFSEMWTRTSKGYHDLDGGRALDPTHPGTQARIRYIIGKLKDCGFKMIKIDFLGHAAAESSHFFNPAATTGMQAYRIGMEFLTKELDNSMLIYAAISPSLATARYVHMRRIACDSWKSIENTEYTLNSVTYGWWQTYMYDYIDADHLVFGNETEGANRARLISGLITGPVMLGDDYSLKADWQPRIKRWLQQPALKPLIRKGKAFMPVEGNTGTSASRVFIRKDGDAYYLAVFNYKKSPGSLKLDAARLGLNPSKSYQVTELLDGSQTSFTGDFNVDFNGEGAYIYRISLP